MGDRNLARGPEADNSVVLDLQPHGDLPAVVAIVAILEPDASGFSVPSKVLTSLCTSRAIAGELPSTTPSPRSSSGAARAGSWTPTSRRRWPKSWTTNGAPGHGTGGPARFAEQAFSISLEDGLQNTYKWIFDQMSEGAAPLTR